MARRSGRQCRNRQPPLVLRFLREPTQTALLRDTFLPAPGEGTPTTREQMSGVAPRMSAPISCWSKTAHHRKQTVRAGLAPQGAFGATLRACPGPIGQGLRAHETQNQKPKNQGGGLTAANHFKSKSGQITC